MALLFLNPPGFTLAWDAFGYYLYLPAFFLHKDPLLLHQEWLHQAMETYKELDTGGFYQAHQVANGNWVMKYPLGMALIWSPFVAVAHLLAPTLGYPADGFSRPYQIAVVVAEMAYVLAGLLMLRKVLLHWWSDLIVSITLVLVVLGTNYLHQALFANSMPHIFLFTLQVGVLYGTMRWHIERRSRHALLITLCIGLAALARPTEVILLLIPLLWGKAVGMDFFRRNGNSDIRRKRVMMTGVLAGVALIGSVQLIYWKYASGSFFHMSYTGDEEGFDFLPPYTWEALFSFRKGWFIYTPMMLLAVLGFTRLRRDAPEVRNSVIIFILLNIYIVTSWSNWWYSESFGHRGLMQSIAVMSIPLAALVATAEKTIRIKRLALITAFLAFVFLNLFQTWQSAVGLIPGSRMSFSYYMAIFGKTHGISDMERRLLVDRWGPLPTDLHEDAYHHLVRRLYIYGDQTEEDTIKADRQKPRTGSKNYSGAEAFSPGFKIPFDELTAENNLWLRVKASINHTGPNASGAIVLCMEHHGKLYGYKTIEVNSDTKSERSTFELDATYLTPELRGKSDLLCIYYWHRSGVVDLGTISAECFEPVVPSPF
ncbi:MAG: hypothetical protein WBO28_08260 [Flavobacteriales bacterium]